IGRNLQWPEGVALNADLGGFVARFGHKFRRTPPNPMFSAQGYADRHEKQVAQRAPATATFSGNGQGGRLLRLHSQASQASRVWRRAIALPPAQARSVQGSRASVSSESLQQAAPGHSQEPAALRPRWPLRIAGRIARRDQKNR